MLEIDLRCDKTHIVIYVDFQSTKQTLWLVDSWSDWDTIAQFPCKLNSQFSQKFPTMQISSDLKSLELLEISGKGRLQFCEDLEFL